jgi:pyruvate dehydrogenase E2 component (dihydrolipoamide acetyltransferase)
VPNATEVSVPDLGDFTDVPVIEIHVAAGDVVSAEDPLITLESDKATMDIPAPAAGTVRELRVQIGDRVSKGTPLLVLDTGGALSQPPPLTDQQEPPDQEAVGPVAAAREPARQPAAAAPPPETQTSAPVTAVEAGTPGDFDGVHAGPGVRRLARELGLDLTAMSGTGPKGRVTKEDLLARVRGPAATATSAPAAAQGAGIPEIPAQDFSKFGPVETRPLSRIQRLSGPQLHRSWLNIPHVTHNDEADITDLDAYRKELDTAAKAEGYRVTLLAFLLKASVSALREFPKFNSSLTPEKDALIYKGYYHIGVAVDTPDGLVVPVIRDVDRKGIRELSQELGAVSGKARDGKLGLADLQGGCFTISSLGGGDSRRGALQDRPGVGRDGVRASIDAAGIALLRSPGHRRCPGGPFCPAPVPPARGHPPARAVTATRRSAQQPPATPGA